MNAASPTGGPVLSQAGLEPTRLVDALDEHGAARQSAIAAERALTLYLDRREIVTLMTLGTQPERLVLGYLLNQQLVDQIESIVSVQVDWSVQAAVVTTRGAARELEQRLAQRTITSGCGQGTMFGRIEAALDHVRLAPTRLSQAALYRLLAALSQYNEVYRRAGAVHGCALCSFADEGVPRIDLFVEDVGRHNAADAITGYMRLEALDGGGRVFYTTGRLTSEMVIKVAQMGVSVLVSRSGITEMGLSLARRLGVMMVARAKGRHFLLYNGAERFDFDSGAAPG